MPDITARFRDNVNILRAATKDWDGSIQSCEATPIEGVIRVGDLIEAADEIDRLRARVAALEADKARLVEALYDAANTLGLWEPTPQPALKRASAVLSEMKGDGDASG